MEEEHNIGGVHEVGSWSTDTFLRPTSNEKIMTTHILEAELVRQ